MLEAPALGKVKVNGDFEPDVTIVGNDADVEGIGKMKAGGRVSGEWDVAGGAGKLQVGTAGGWTARFTGDVGGLKVDGDLTVDWQSRTLGKVKIGGDLTDSVFDLTGEPAPGDETLAKMKVDGVVRDTVVLTAGDVGKLQVGAAIGLDVLAGAATDRSGGDLSVEGFDTRASLDGLKIKGTDTVEYGLRDSNLAAWEIGKLDICDALETADSLGIEADTIEKFTYSGEDEKVSFKDVNAQTLADELDWARRL